MDVGGVTYSTEWFQYCGVQDVPAVAPEAEQDNAFRYDASSPYDWQNEAVSAGDPMNLADFEDYDTWGNAVGRGGLGKPATGTWLDAAAPENVIAWLAKCTHFCCVPGFKTTPQSTQFGAENEVYCPCHQSVYDPFSLVTESFVALPRPDD